MDGSSNCVHGNLGFVRAAHDIGDLFLESDMSSVRLVSHFKWP